VSGSIDDRRRLGTWLIGFTCGMAAYVRRWSRLACWLRERTGTCLWAFAALDGAVDGGAGNAEQVTEFGGGVLAAAQQLDQVCLLAGG
jgi:hypothetical protein